MARAVILLSLVGSVSAFLPQPARGFAHPSRSATVVDTEKYQNIATKYSVEGLPTVVLFKGGKEVHRLMGLYNKEQLISELGPFL